MVAAKRCAENLEALGKLGQRRLEKCGRVEERKKLGMGR
jgi:hypothetical protein